MVKTILNKFTFKKPSPEFFILLSIFGSIIFSIYLYFGCYIVQQAIFMGIWAPFLLGVISFIKLKFK